MPVLKCFTIIVLKSRIGVALFEFQIGSPFYAVLFDIFRLACRTNNIFLCNIDTYYAALFA